ncbi:hypothetical protein PspLS_10626 [Pyricularia sp. CBS 133598]|nr:hypothetical protein PspLS_10626 [Pyricularia sp. CBS 133598]
MESFGILGLLLLGVSSVTASQSKKLPIPKTCADFRTACKDVCNGLGAPTSNVSDCAGEVPSATSKCSCAFKG